VSHILNIGISATVENMLNERDSKLLSGEIKKKNNIIRFCSHLLE